MINNIFLLSNVKNHFTISIISSLKEIKEYFNKEHVIMGIYTIGHYLLHNDCYTWVTKIK